LAAKRAYGQIVPIVGRDRLALRRRYAFTTQRVISHSYLSLLPKVAGVAHPESIGRLAAAGSAHVNSGWLPPAN